MRTSAAIVCTDGERGAARRRVRKRVGDDEMRDAAPRGAARSRATRRTTRWSYSSTTRAASLKRGVTAQEVHARPGDRRDRCCARPEGGLHAQPDGRARHPPGRLRRDDRRDPLAPRRRRGRRQVLGCEGWRSLDWLARRRQAPASSWATDDGRLGAPRSAPSPPRWRAVRPYDERALGRARDLERGVPTSPTTTSGDRAPLARRRPHPAHRSDDGPRASEDFVKGCLNALRAQPPGRAGRECARAD